MSEMKFFLVESTMIALRQYQASLGNIGKKKERRVLLVSCLLGDAFEL